MIRNVGCARWALGLFLLLAAGPTGHSGGPAARPEVARWSEEINKRLDTELGSLEKLYRTLHASPELSFEEEQTAARMARELKALGFEVTTGVGGHGVVGV